MGEKKPRGPAIPEKPLNGQDLPPCRGPTREIRGGCWLGTEFTPPCPPELFEYGQRCYSPTRRWSGDKVGRAE